MPQEAALRSATGVRHVSPVAKPPCGRGSSSRGRGGRSRRPPKRASAPSTGPGTAAVGRLGNSTRTSLASTHPAGPVVRSTHELAPPTARSLSTIATGCGSVLDNWVGDGSIRALTGQRPTRRAGGRQYRQLGRRVRMVRRWRRGTGAAGVSALARARGTRSIAERRAGYRQLNAAIHRVGLTQARSSPRSHRLPATTRRTRPPTRKEAIRSLRRRRSDVIYRTMLADAALHQQRPTDRAACIGERGRTQIGARVRLNRWITRRAQRVRRRGVGGDPGRSVWRSSFPPHRPGGHISRCRSRDRQRRLTLVKADGFRCHVGQISVVGAVQLCVALTTLAPAATDQGPGEGAGLPASSVTVS